MLLNTLYNASVSGAQNIRLAVSIRKWLDSRGSQHPGCFYNDLGQEDSRHGAGSDTGHIA